MKKIFPIETYLHIFQLEGYSPLRLINWWVTHPLTRVSGTKKPLVWTSKATWLYFLSLVLTLAGVLKLFFFAGGISLIVGSLFLILFPILQLIVALMFLKPYEAFNKNRTIKDTQDKIKSLKNLKVIGITGSYGKTSVKEYLYGILKTKYSVLKTPKSYNTVFGIAKVVEYELDDSYDYFVCEMGAYKRGDIKELCNLVYPTYGILTGIAEQHLDRFGSLQNIILGKFELPEFLPKSGLALLNTDNEHISSHQASIQAKVITYGFNDRADGKVSNIRMTKSGTTFDFTIEKKKVSMTTRLLGRAAIQNIAGASVMAYKLGMTLKEIAQAVEGLETVPFRLEIMKRGAITIINDAYNSNTEGFREALMVLSDVQGTRKVLVTPGIVDLGNKTYAVHKELGIFAADKITDVILVSKSDRTRGLEDGLKEANFKEVTTVANLAEAQKLIEKYPSGSVVLLENDLPDNY
jgi:UDP-N-acetylmuramoyl-tripeptide--D-alanyl-D-alanine ligase